MEPESEFQMVTFLEPHIADIPPLGFPNLDNSSRWDSDISDSCPPSPSPLSSPSPHSSASSSESGIEDSSDMEEAIPTVRQTANGPLVVKVENPPSPLDALNQSPLKITKKRRKGHKKTRNGSDVLEELNKLLVETMERSVSLTSALMDHSQSPIFQSPAQISGLGDKVEGSVQTTASPTSVSHSCPQSVQVSQTTTLLPSSHHVPISSQSTSTLAIPKLSMPPPVASSSKVNNKHTNPRKRDEPKIVIIEEPEEVFALNISENFPDCSVLIICHCVTYLRNRKPVPCFYRVIQT